MPSPLDNAVKLPEPDATGGFDPGIFDRLKSGGSSAPAAPTNKDLDLEEAKGKQALTKDESTTSKTTDKTLSTKPAGEELEAKGDDSKSDEQGTEPEGEEVIKPLELKKPVAKEDSKEEAKVDDKPKPGRPKKEYVIPEGVDPRIKAFLNDMSANAREYTLGQLADKAKQIEQLKAQQGGALPPAYFEHPDAWTLHPDVKESGEAMERETWAKNHWQKQFKAVREGEKEWQDLGVDADGKLIAIPRAPSAEAETYLLGKLQHADQVINNHKQRVGYIQHNFKGIVEQAFGTIKTLETQLFPQFADPEATKNNTHIQTMTKTLESRQLNKTPLSSMFTKLYAHSREQQDYIAELEAKVNGGQFAKKDLGLNSSDFSGDGGTGKVLTGDDKPFRMDDFEKLKMGR